jgi:hypothetical protein
VQNVPDGEVFWFITRGSLSGAMPSWASLPEQQRWQLVTYLKTLVSAPIVAPAPVAAPMTPITAPPPLAPFTDFRFEVPGAVHKIAVSLHTSSTFRTVADTGRGTSPFLPTPRPCSLR